MVLLQRQPHVPGTRDVPIGGSWVQGGRVGNDLVLCNVHTHMFTHAPLAFYFFLQCDFILPLAVLGNASQHLHQEKL